MTKSSPDIVRQFFLEEHPNPERIGCPPEETLQAAAENRLPVTDPARVHMAKCSECFAEYRGYRIDWESKQAAKRRFLGWAVAAAVLLAALGGAFAFSHHSVSNKAPQEIADNTTPHGGLTPPTDNPVVTPAPKQEEPHKPARLDTPTPRHTASHHPPVGTSTPVPVTDKDESVAAVLDLSRQRKREPDGTRGNSYNLASANLKLTILLPSTAKTGPYTVQVASDPEGQEVIASTTGEAVQKEGALSLEVPLLLKGQKAGPYYLVVGPEGTDKPTVYGVRIVLANATNSIR